MSGDGQNTLFESRDTLMDSYKSSASNNVTIALQLALVLFAEVGVPHLLSGSLLGGAIRQRVILGPVMALTVLFMLNALLMAMYWSGLNRVAMTTKLPDTTNGDPLPKVHGTCEKALLTGSIPRKSGDPLKTFDHKRDLVFFLGRSFLSGNRALIYVSHRGTLWFTMGLGLSLFALLILEGFGFSSVVLSVSWPAFYKFGWLAVGVAAMIVGGLLLRNDAWNTWARLRETETL